MYKSIINFILSLLLFLMISSCTNQKGLSDSNIIIDLTYLENRTLSRIQNSQIDSAYIKEDDLHLIFPQIQNDECLKKLFLQSNGKIKKSNPPQLDLYLPIDSTCLTTKTGHYRVNLVSFRELYPKGIVFIINKQRITYPPKID